MTAWIPVETVRRDPRRAAILAGSVLFHIAVLGVLGLETGRVLKAKPVEDQLVYLSIEPRPLLIGETARAPTPTRVRPTVETRPLTHPLATRADPRKKDEDAPSPPAPRIAASVGGPPGVATAPGATNPWTYTPEAMGAAVARSMRTGAGGCRVMDGHLSAAEQALCDERFIAGAVEGASRHPPGARTLTPSERRREEGFAAEGAAALRRYEARRAPLRPGSGNVTSGECPGGNFGTGCAGAHLAPSMREGAQGLNRMDTGRLNRQPLPGHHD